MNKFFCAIIFISSNLLANVCAPCPRFCPPSPPCDEAFNAPFLLGLLCEWDIQLSASFLYYQAEEENLNIGTIVTQQIAPTLDPIASSKNIATFDFCFKPGFKVGGGIFFELDRWQLFAEYTYFHQTTKGSVGPLNGQTTSGLIATQQFLVPDWLFQKPSTLAFLQAEGSWDLRLDMLDIQLAREFYIGSCLTFRSYGGILAYWIRQKLELTYEGTQGFTGAPLQNFIEANNELTTKCWGIGPSVGLDMKWRFFTGFRFFASPSLSLVYTRYTNITEKGSLTYSSPTSVDTVSQASVLIDPCFVRPVAEITLGFGWGSYFYCDKWFFDLELGYNTSVFWNQNMFLVNSYTQDLEQLPSKTRGGDLSLSGLVVTASFQF